MKKRYPEVPDSSPQSPFLRLHRHTKLHWHSAGYPSKNSAIMIFPCSYLTMFNIKFVSGLGSFKSGKTKTGTKFDALQSWNRKHEINVKGRHDPCIAIRAVPVITSVSAIAVYDLILRSGTGKI